MGLLPEFVGREIENSIGVHVKGGCAETSISSFRYENESRKTKTHPCPSRINVQLFHRSQLKIMEYK